MTFRELLQIEHPDMVDEKWAGGCYGCPCDFGYESGAVKDGLCRLCRLTDDWRDNCRRCWDRESGLDITASYDEDDKESVAGSDDLDELDVGSEVACNYCNHYKDTPWCVDCEDKCHVCAHEAVCKFKDEFFGERKICRNFLKTTNSRNS